MDTLGLVESRSIAAGAQLADGMMKAAAVELVRASTICSGRYLISVSGEREAVATAVAFARSSSRGLAGSFVLSSIDPRVVAVMKKACPVETFGALAVIECRTASAGIAAADCAVKRVDVCLARLVTGQGINGKSYFVLSGDAASVTEAAEAASAFLGKGLVEAVVLPRPDASVVRALVTGAG